MTFSLQPFGDSSRRLLNAFLAALITVVLVTPGQPQELDISREEIDALLALGYLDYTEDVVSESEYGVVHKDPLAMSSGYTAVTTRMSCLIEVLDPSGTVVHAWQYKPCHHWSNFAITRDGDIVIPVVEEFGQITRQNWMEAHALVKIDWNGNLVWKLRIPAHHDTDVVPGGDILTLTEEYRKIPEISADLDVRDNSLALVTADGKVREKISLYDLFRNFTKENDGLEIVDVSVRKVRGQPEIDLFHANSVEWMTQPKLEEIHPIFALGNVLVSVRHQNSIVMIDWSEKEIVWAWGQGEISGPHDATVLPNGHIMVFDNGIGRKWSRVIEIDPRSGQIVWQYSASDPEDFFTRSRGSNQRLPNGNTLIANSDSGEVFEVTPGGEVVWRYLNPHSNDKGHRATIVRAWRFPKAFMNGLLRNQYIHSD